jgi:hypothetical protein
LNVAANFPPTVGFSTVRTGMYHNLQIEPNVVMSVHTHHLPTTMAPAVSTAACTASQQEGSKAALGLPDALWTTILGFVGNTRDFRACERTCQSLRRILQDDILWSHWGSQFTNPDLIPIPSQRENCLYHEALLGIDAVEEFDYHLLTSVLTVPEWKELVRTTLAERLPQHLTHGGQVYMLRGDASTVLLCIIENCLVAQLYRAQTFTVRAGRFTVTLDDFKLQDGMHNISGYITDDMTRGNLVPLLAWERPDEKHNDDSFGVARRQKDRIACRLALRAKIVCLEYKMYRWIWETLVNLIVLLLQPICEELTYAILRPPVEAYPNKMPLVGNESFRDVAPYPKNIGICSCCGIQIKEHTLVPGQIEKSARRLGICTKVYGDFWHVDLEMVGSDREHELVVAAEVSNAADEYLYVENDCGYYAPVSDGPEDEYETDDEYFPDDEMDSDEELDSEYIDEAEMELDINSMIQS